MTSINMTNFHYLFKYIIVGDSCKFFIIYRTAVGKSNILLQFSQKKFKTDHEITIGVEFGAKNISIGDDKIYRIQIWDTAGQETFKSITRAYYKNSVCAFLVYDISKKESFNNIASWLEECKAQSPKTVFIVLVGNKVDLSDKREVTYEEGLEIALKNKMMFFECSAKTGFNIEEVFIESAKQIARKIKEGFYDLSYESCGIKRGMGFGDTPDGKVDHLLSYADMDKKKKKKGCC